MFSFALGISLLALCVGPLKCGFHVVLWILTVSVQDESNVDPEVSKREKARLREMQQLKKQKVQEILDAQNATIDADMVCVC